MAEQKFLPNPKREGFKKYRSAHNTGPNRRLFIEELARTGNVTRAAHRINVSRNTVYHWREHMPNEPVTLQNGEEFTFIEAWDNALEEGLDLLEEFARERATVGYKEPVVYQGRLSYHTYPPNHPLAGELILNEEGMPIPITINRPSDNLLVQLLRAKRPDEFGIKQQVDNTHRVATGGVLAIPVREGEDWEQAAMEHAKDTEASGQEV